MPSDSTTKKILDADFQNLIKKVASGKPLTAAERALVQARQSAIPQPEAAEAYAKNKVQLAKALNVTRPALDAWFKMPGAPKADSAGRHDVTAWLQFRDAQGLKGAEVKTGGSVVNQKARECLLRNDKLEFQLEVLKKRYTKNEVFVADLEAVSNELRTILRQKLENEYPPIVAGMEPAQVRVYSKRLVDELFRLIGTLKEKFRC